MSAKLTYEFVKEEIEKKGGQILSTEYIDYDHPLEILGSCGHKFVIKYASIKQGSWCQECAKKACSKAARKYDKKFVEAFIKERKGQLLSEFHTVNGIIEVRCEAGHTWNPTFETLLRGCWCRHCANERLKIDKVGVIQCTKCGNFKDVSLFSHSNGKCGSRCKACTTADCVERRKKNIQKYKETQRKYTRNRMKTDLNFKIRVFMRNRIRKILKRATSCSAFLDKHLGCSVDELKVYLEARFYPHPKTGEMMMWDNWGTAGWHIDHIVPLSFFDLTDESQAWKACNYTNLQPLWAEENLKKGDKI